ncbi:MAG: hypothetical protein M1813_008694 [Trichoglossum hirsutum]|nr:MAG: hypothetical protein M1813_008694 [Trichoglossum hirsutum]
MPTNFDGYLSCCGRAHADPYSGFPERGDKTFDCEDALHSGVVIQRITSDVRPVEGSYPFASNGRGTVPALCFETTICNGRFKRTAEHERLGAGKKLKSDSPGGEPAAIPSSFPSKIQKPARNFTRIPPIRETKFAGPHPPHFPQAYGPDDEQFSKLTGLNCSYISHSGGEAPSLVNTIAAEEDAQYNIRGMTTT